MRFGGTLAHTLPGPGRTGRQAARCQGVFGTGINATPRSAASWLSVGLGFYATLAIANIILFSRCIVFSWGWMVGCRQAGNPATGGGGGVGWR